MADFVEKRCAVCQLIDGLVIGVIIASASYPPPEGHELIEIMTDQQCNIGWHWDGELFIPAMSEAT
jgi:hypothetical protein